MLHATKNQSILQWYNALTSSVNVQSLSQFSDGSLFYNIVESVYSQAQIENPVPKFLLPDSSICEESSSDISAADKTPSVKDAERPEENASTSTQQDAVETAEDLSEDSVSRDSNNKIEIQRKYDLIQKFIDNFFQIESNNIITYSACMEGKDLELAKVAVLLLSAMVQNFLSSKNEALQTITLLEDSVQEDIRECLSLMLERSDKDSLTKTELHKALGKATRHKATPRRKTSHRGNSVDTPASKRKQRLTTIIYEDVQDSPLKGLLQSPNNSQHRAAIAMFRKETEISKLRNALHEEEMKNTDLRLEKKQLDDTLMKKNEEIEYMKNEFRKYKETTEEREAHYSMERANHSETINNLNSLIYEQQEEIKSLQEEQAGYLTAIAELEKKLLQKTNAEESADKIIIETLREKIQGLESEIESKGNMIQECMEKNKYLEKDAMEYKQMYEERLSRRDTPRMSPPTRETVGSIQLADAQEAVSKLQEKEKDFQELKKFTSSIKKQLQEKTDNIQAVLDKLSNLQNKHEKLLLISRDCHSCRIALESEESDASRDSSHVGKLWDSSKNSAPTTRSKSNASFTSSIPVSFTSLERLRNSLRTFCKLLINWNFVEAMEWYKIETESQNLENVDGFLHHFEHILNLMKKVVPPAIEAVASEVKTVKGSVDEKDSSKELIRVKKRFATMAAALKADLARKDNELNSAKEQVQNLLLEKASIEKERAKLDTNLKNLQKEYDGVYKSAQKYKNEKKALHLKRLDLQNQINSLQNKVEPCSTCDGLHKMFLEARKDLHSSEMETSELKMNIKDLLSKIKSLERSIKDITLEKQKLEDKIQHNNAFLFGSASARTALINKYYQQSLAESKKNSLPDLDDLESDDSQPVVNVNTFFLCPERKKPQEKSEPCPETSMSNHFANKSIKSAYLQTEDEEDFLNHSSLSQIQGGYFEMECANPEQRLRELQRRNTLCPPHLQSSYPLEIQNMTPSERKYSMLPSQIQSTSCNKEALKKRKASEIDNTHSNVSNRKVMRMSTTSSASAKVRTPVRLTSALKKGKTFKTPSSIRRLMRMPQRKHKEL